MEACARCAAEKASFTQMSPSFARLGDKCGIVLLFACVEARVLQAEDVAGLHRGDGLFRGLADAVVGERDRPLDDARHLGGDRFQRLLRIAPLRPAEMREQDDLAALVGDFGDGRRHTLDTRCVGDVAVLDRHVEIDAHEHALAFHVDVVERSERSHDRA